MTTFQKFCEEYGLRQMTAFHWESGDYMDEYQLHYDSGMKEWIFSHYWCEDGDWYSHSEHHKNLNFLMG